jgi:hypothetical protein
VTNHYNTSQLNQWHTTGTTAQMTYLPLQPNYAGDHMPPGYSGNPSDNLRELEEVREHLRRRRDAGQVEVALVPDTTSHRLIKPLFPVTEMIHPDNHLAWLRGRTLSVCRKLSWSKAA